ncbi:MAG TPA: chain length-determining protein [Gammaproteobacteria bacterium]|nr:chain length-determining protein [Gammaproteobacteria bacterium]
MQETIEQYVAYVKGAWRFRWYVHLIAWPLCLLGWTTVYLIPDHYEASARVYVDTQSLLRPLLKGIAVQTDTRNEVEIMTRTLLSRPNLEKVARMTDLDLEATTPEEMERLMLRLEHDIQLKGRGRDNLYRITYANEDPEKAKQVVQALLTIFVETSLGDTRKDTDIAQRFLDEQIEEYEARLIAAEEALKEFKRRNVGMMPKEGQEYYQQLQEARADLSQAQLELSEAIQRRDELRRQIRTSRFPHAGSQEASPGLVAASSPLDIRIQNLQQRLDELLLRYTEKHPDVVATRRTIEALQKQQAEMARMMSESASSESATVLASSPVYQQLKILLGEAEATVAALQVRVDRYQKEVTDLREKMDVIPQVEADLKRLNRDYGINKRNYEELLARRESAKISQEAGQSSESVKFRIVDPPYVPLKPSAPNRPLLITAVLFGGFLVGGGFAFFLSQLRPAFDNTRQVLEELGIPVFGIVSRIWTGRARLKRRAEVMAFGLAGLLLVGFYGIYMAYTLLSLPTLGF